MKEIAVIDYNAGNIQSVLFALDRIGVKPLLSNDPDRLYHAEKIIFPGVGEASTTMAHLKKHQLDTLIQSYNKPFLGICLGLQLMCRHSEEGDVDCLNVFDLPVRRFPEKAGLKVPHMGWNTVSFNDHPLFKDIAQDSYFYFVHSFYAAQSESTIGQTTYGLSFASSIARDNYMATQFHPEKSGVVGQLLLNNFINL
ncbi:imidazole glycerol phosphate synthase subunit HisH [Membranicola marinus]|uniref:Imidazole glycerol phosphate synthase subunit HisH n=1 Tax=Membranihabitans marinus TaxID=1227546 RepID=A0A953HW42_9BACT|nr:imidazole glycerol phosphate synthase subunit HisH [Membranihabitans marinus]MBY5958893.1 imidazole glycerol phosphate synthase subunit HisH [Membranihabitans marinus]